jgi:hypothetical protein
MKRIPRRIVITALALVGMFCVVRAPLSPITLFLPAVIQLKNVEGSLWNGRASAVGVGGMIVQEAVAWHFAPPSVLSGTLAWRLSGRFGDKTSELRLAWRPGGAELDSVSMFLPLAPLAALYPQLKAAQLGALLHATTAHLSPRAPTRVAVDVDQVSSALIPQAGQLGRFRVDVDVAADGKGNWTLSSLPGLLAATGQGQLDVNRSHIDGQVVLTPSAPIPGLSALLAQLPKAGEGFLIAL